MAAGLVKPLLGAMETALAESAADADSLLAEAEAALRTDPAVASALGSSDLRVGGVFSSSSSNINGAKTIQLQVPAYRRRPCQRKVAQCEEAALMSLHRWP